MADKSWLVGRMLKGRTEFQGGEKLLGFLREVGRNTARVGRVLMELEILNEPAGSSTGHRSLIAFRMELQQARFVQETE